MSFGEEVQSSEEDRKVDCGWENQLALLELLVNVDLVGLNKMKYSTRDVPIHSGGDSLLCIVRGLSTCQGWREVVIRACL